MQAVKQEMMFGEKMGIVFDLVAPVMSGTGNEKTEVKIGTCKLMLMSRERVVD